MNHVDDTTRSLLAVVHRGGYYSYWWTDAGKQSTWWPVDKPEPLPGGQVNIYFGVHLGDKAKGRDERTKIEDVAAVNCFYGEFDAFNAARKERKPTHFDNKEVALAHIQSLPFPPSVIVDSGGGYYGFWLLQDPFLIQSEDDRTRARVAQRAWVSLIGSDDDAKDLARILRVTGTFNYKPAYGPDFPKVLLLNGSDFDRRYTFDELEQAALAKQQQEAAPRPQHPFTPTTPDLEIIADALRYIPIHQDYEDWVRVLMAVHSAYPGVEGVAICEAWSPGYSGEIEAKFRGFSETGNASGRVTMGTLFHLAKAHGWRPGTTQQVERRNGHHPPEPDERPPMTESEEPPDTADNGSATRPYDVRDGQMVYQYRARDEDGKWQIRKIPITTFVAHITEEITTEDGGKHFRVEGETVHRRSFSFEIEAGEFSQNRVLKATITQAAGTGAAVLAKQSEHLVPGIMRLSLPDQVKQTRRYDRTGWADDKLLIPGREPEGMIIHLPRKLPYCLPDDADLGTGLMALEALASSMPATATTPILAMLFQAPMAKLANWRNERYGLFIRGRTGSLKTSFSQVGMALYGPGFMRDDLIVKWGEGATRNAIMALARHAHDMPLLIDNYKPSTGGGARDFINLTHSILEGGEKDRLTRASELRETHPIFCWPMVTGEDVPDSDPASLARILVVDFPWQDGQANDNLTIAQESACHLCAVGRAWLDWLESETGQDAAKQAAAQFPKMRGQWAEYIRKHRPDTVNVLRVASNLATNHLTWWAMEQHPHIGEVAKRFHEDHQKGLAEIAQRMAGHTTEALEAVRYLEALRELLSSGRCILLDKGSVPLSNDQDKVIGWKDGSGGALLMPVITRQAVERVLGRDGLGGISDKTLYSQLATMKHIASSAANRTTKLVKVRNDVVRVLHLKASAILPDDEPTEVQEGIEDGG